jgi:threonine/homoserine/homoserine lactone efflux protein
MTLALTIGLRFGMRAVAWMMTGELIGVGLVASLSAVGVATILLSQPWLFNSFKLAGGAYLMFIGVQMWRAKGKFALSETSVQNLSQSPFSLASQGFTTAIANPKGWAFFVALLPPFLDAEKNMFSQLSIFVLIILGLEALCLMLYGAGGKTLSHFLNKETHRQTLNRISGGLLAGVGIWLMLS